MRPLSQVNYSVHGSHFTGSLESHRYLSDPSISATHRRSSLDLTILLTCKTPRKRALDGAPLFEPGDVTVHNGVCQFQFQRKYSTSYTYISSTTTPNTHIGPIVSQQLGRSFDRRRSGDDPRTALERDRHCTLPRVVPSRSRSTSSASVTLSPRSPSERATPFTVRIAAKIDRTASEREPACPNERVDDASRRRFSTRSAQPRFPLPGG